MPGSGFWCWVLRSSFWFRRRSAVAQGRISNARTETRSAAQGLEPRSARGGGARRRHVDRLPHADGRRAAADVLLRHDLGLVVLGRYVPPRKRRRRVDEHAATYGIAQRLARRARAGHASSSCSPGWRAARVSRVRTFTPDCDIDAGGDAARVVDRRQPRRQRRWLSSLVTSSSDTGERHDRVGKTALSAIALHNVAVGGSRARRLRRPGTARNGCAPRPRSGWAMRAARPARGSSRG